MHFQKIKYVSSGIFLIASILLSPLASGESRGSGNALFKKDTPSREGNAKFKDLPRSGNAKFKDLPRSGNAKFKDLLPSGNAKFKDLLPSGNAKFKDLPRSGNAKFKDLPRSGNAKFKDLLPSGNAKFKDLPRSGNAKFKDLPRSGNAKFKEKTSRSARAFKKNALSSALGLGHGVKKIPTKKIPKDARAIIRALGLERKKKPESQGSGLLGHHQNNRETGSAPASGNALRLR